MINYISGKEHMHWLFYRRNDNFAEIPGLIMWYWLKMVSFPLQVFPVDTLGGTQNSIYMLIKFNLNAR